MDGLLGLHDPVFWGVAIALAVLGGAVKGAVGFALPMVMISGLASVVAPETALACAILPACAGNLWQALRHGRRAAMQSIRRYRRFLVAGGVAIVLAAQLVPALSQRALLLIIAAPITVYALAALSGRPLRLPTRLGRRTEIGLGALTGGLGGMTGIWGPITVAMLSAQDVSKAEQVRVQGVIYGLGALVLVGAHLGSGVLNRATLPVSAALIVPALAGMALGFQVQDRIAQATFRRLTMLVLLVVVLNLMRRALGGG